METQELKQLVGQYGGRETAEKLLNNYAKKYFVVTLLAHSYAEGITGTTYYATIHTNHDFGFKTKTEADILYRMLKKTKKTRITQKNRGYGALGDFYNHKIMSNVELASFLTNNKYPCYNFTIV